jgi:hypothetical protein
MSRFIGIESMKAGRLGTVPTFVPTTKPYRVRQSVSLPLRNLVAQGSVAFCSTSSHSLQVIGLLCSNSF